LRGWRNVPEVADQRGSILPLVECASGQNAVMAMIRVIGQPAPEDAWVHRFRNLGEEAYVKLRDRWAVDIDEIDASFDTFHIEVPGEEVPVATAALNALIDRHHMTDTVIAVELPWRARFAVSLVTDPAYGERLRSVVTARDTWVVQSDANRAVVQAMREEQRGGITIWSEPNAAVSTEDWLAMLGTIELHHGAPSCEPPMDRLDVYGSTLTPPIESALREYEYGKMVPTRQGFVALKLA
jgi:hypothetical protein